MKVAISCFRWNLLAYRTDRARPLDLEKYRSHPSKSSNPIPRTYKEGELAKTIMCMTVEGPYQRSELVVSGLVAEVAVVDGGLKMTTNIVAPANLEAESVEKCIDYRQWVFCPETGRQCIHLYVEERPTTLRSEPYLRLPAQSRVDRGPGKSPFRQIFPTCGTSHR